MLCGNGIIKELNRRIAAFFRNIGYADQLGSGVRNLFKYSRFYSGREPEFVEGDIFRITVPLDDTYSYDFENNGQTGASRMPVNANGVPVNVDKMPVNANEVPIDADKMPINIRETATVYEGISLTEQQTRILRYLQKYEEITSARATELLGIRQRRARDILKQLTDKNILRKRGSYRNTVYMLNLKEKQES